MSKDAICQFCIFRKGTTDCKLGIIDNAKQAGKQVVECWNEHGEFNVIADTPCMFQRPASWKKLQAKKERESSLELLAASEIKCRFSAIIVCGPNETLEDIKLSIDSLAEQKHRPEHVVIARESGNKVDSKEFLDHLRHKKFVDWRIENLIDTERVQRKAVEICLKFKTRPYFASFRAGRAVDKDFFWTLNDKITKHFFTFAIIKNDNDPVDGVIVPKVIYQYFGNHFHELEKYIQKEDMKCQGILNIQKVGLKFQ